MKSIDLKEQNLKLGIVGGMGSETSCKLCMNLSNRVRSVIDRQPDICMDILSLSKKAQDRMIRGERCLEHFKLIARSIISLEANGCNLIVVPCNAAHVFIEELRSLTDVSILSIPEEVANLCFNKNFGKVGILGSSMTIKSQLHENELLSRGLDVIFPEDNDQNFLDGLILSILDNSVKNLDKKKFMKIINDLKSRGAEAVVLACTDFGNLVFQENLGIELVDTLRVLENSIFNKITGRAGK